jgi:hypothetical protein
MFDKLYSLSLRHDKGKEALIKQGTEPYGLCPPMCGTATFRSALEYFGATPRLGRSPKIIGAVDGGA